MEQEYFEISVVILQMYASFSEKSTVSQQRILTTLTVSFGIIWKAADTLSRSEINKQGI